MTTILDEPTTAMRTRRFELIPLRGPNSPFTDTQGRGWGTTITDSPTELIDLISSIGTIGLLQPISIEDIDGNRRVISGHRRFAAMRLGAKEQPDNPHFAALATNIFTGPLSAADIRTWQLVENLARTDLQPGELAAALLYHRSALLTTLLTEHNHPPPEHVAAIEDPAQRWDALDNHRRTVGLHHTGIPWSTAISRLGLELTETKAKRLVAAFRAMPPEIASDMDAHNVSLTSRHAWIRLHRNGREQAANDIWAAIKELDNPRLLSLACAHSTDHPDTDAGDSIDHALQTHADADQARADAQTPTEDPTGDPVAEAVTTVDETLITNTLNALAALTEALTAPEAALDRYTTGSLRLALTQLQKTLL